MTDQQAASAAARGFTVGNCLGTSLAVFKRNFGPLAVLGLVLSLPSLAFVFYTISNAGDLATTGGGAGYYWTIFGGVVVSIFVSALISAAVIYGSFQDLRGRPASFGDCLSRGLAAIFPVVIASILGSLAIGFASLLLVIPGIIVFLMIWVYIPVIVVEGAGITASFGRSAQLTAGRRWSILGLVLILIVVGAVIQIVISKIIPVTSMTSIYVGGVVEFFVQSLLSVFTAITTTVGYYLLRSEKEGVDIDEIAKVFD